MNNINSDITQVLSFIATKNYKIGKRKNKKITGFKPLEIASTGDICFCSYKGKKAQDLISVSNATIIICHKNLNNALENTKSTLIFVENPRLWFIRCLQKFIPKNNLRGIHPTAIVESKKMGKNVYIGPFSYIGKNVTINDNVIIYPNVSIYGNCSIGKNVIIDSSCVIGTDGFGFERNRKGNWEKFPHFGGVEIHDDVEIGANTCIDRGTLQNTVIGKGSKVDNLVHIAHNVKIGKNCIIIAQSLIAGSCILEDDVYVSMSTSIRNGVTIGKNAFIGMGAVVTKDIPSKSTVIGVPAKPINKK